LDTEKNIRAFLAIDPPEEILAAISRFQEKLKREISGKLSWTRQQANHLTLKFFGDISSTDVENISSAVKKQAAGAAPLLLKVEKIGVFPDWRKPRVLWLGTTGDTERLTLLQNNLETDFEQLGFPRENRPFRAHLTLARIKVPQSAAGMEAAAKKLDAFSAGEFSASELILFRSKLTLQGAIYTRLATIALGGTI
jgi:RNA 2',3'-cyclic 3'-phosphodiesterase